MHAKRRTEKEIIEILREAERGASIVDICRTHGIAYVTFYKWRKRYGGVEKSEIRRLRDLEKENADLKKALGEHVIMLNATKQVLKKEAGIEGSQRGGADRDGPGVVATAGNDVLCYDLLFTRTEHGETLKVLVLLDEYSRGCLDIYVDRKINAHGVMRVLEKIIKERGAPQHIRSDNGPEFIAKNLRQWFGRHQIRPQYIEPGSPWQNGFAESFNETLRRECLNRELLWSRGETRSVCNWWRQLYTYFRPHSSLGYKTPQEFAQAKDFSLLSPPWDFSKKMALIH